MRVPISKHIRGSTQKKDPTNVNSVVKASVGIPVSRPITESTLGKSHTTVRCVGKASARGQISKLINDFIRERNPTRAMCVVRVFGGAQAFCSIKESIAVIVSVGGKSTGMVRLLRTYAEMKACQMLFCFVN